MITPKTPGYYKNYTFNPADFEVNEKLSPIIKYGMLFIAFWTFLIVWGLLSHKFGIFSPWVVLIATLATLVFFYRMFRNCEISVGDKGIYCSSKGLVPWQNIEYVGYRYAGKLGLFLHLYDQHSYHQRLKYEKWFERFYSAAYAVFFFIMYPPLSKVAPFVWMMSQSRNRKYIFPIFDDKLSHTNWPQIKGKLNLHWECWYH